MRETVLDGFRDSQVQNDIGYAWARNHINDKYCICTKDTFIDTCPVHSPFKEAIEDIPEFVFSQINRNYEIRKFWYMNAIEHYDRETL